MFAGYFIRTIEAALLAAFVALLRGSRFLRLIWRGLRNGHTAHAHPKERNEQDSYDPLHMDLPCQVLLQYFFNVLCS
jgi:hypothetical protein